MNAAEAFLVLDRAGLTVTGAPGWSLSLSPCCARSCATWRRAIVTL